MVLKTFRIFLLFMVIGASAAFAQDADTDSDSSKNVKYIVAPEKGAKVNSVKIELGIEKPKEEAASDLDDPKKIAENVSKFKEQVNKAWDTVVAWWNNEKYNLLILLGGVFVTLLVASAVRWLFNNFIVKLFAGKTATLVDDMVCAAVDPPIRMLIISIGLFLSAIPILLKMPPDIFNIILRIALALMATSVAWGTYRLIAVFNHLLTKLSQRTDNNLDDLIVNMIRKALKITIVVASVLFIGQSILGLNITTLLAGAGVCGLAIAFAAKDTIANFFGSLMIILDKPFKVGERIVFSGVNGVVEHVGLRSTRLRTLDGHLVTVPNSKLADAPIENVGARPYIKFVSNLTLVYDTPAVKVERAVEILHEILDTHDGREEDMPPRIYFNAFNDWSLNIMVIAWFHPGDWVMAQEWNHKTNLEILKRFNAEGIEFAFPTNTTYLAGDSKRALNIGVEQNK